MSSGVSWLDERAAELGTTDVDETPEQTVARLAALSRMAYDKVRETEAESLGIRVSTLDAEVKAARKGTDEGVGAALVMDDPEPWPDPVEGAELLETLAETVRRYLVLNPTDADAAALWIVHTHAHDAATVSPILSITSPQKRCGKTTLLSLLQALTRRPLPASNITAAALFRGVEQWKPTVLVDEADTYLRESDELRGVLNSGHNRAGAYVIRTVGEDHEPRAFSTWSPKAIALIGNMPDTLADRSVAIALRRKTADEKAESLRLDRLDQLEALPRQAAKWADDHVSALRPADPTIPRGLHDRAADNWRPLLAIADAAGGNWPERARRAATALVAHDAPEDAAGVMLLEDIREHYGDHKKITSAQLVETLVTLHERPWPEWRRGKPITTRQVAKLLQPFGIRSRQLRLRDGRAGIHGYLLTDFQDAFARYLGAQSATALRARNGAGSSDSQSATPSEGVADEKTPKPTYAEGCSAVADENPGDGEVRV